MRIRPALVTLFAVLAMPTTGMTQDAQAILKMVRDKQVERWQGVETYVVDQSVMGTRTQSFYSRAEVVDSDGNPHTLFRPNFGNTDPCSAAGQSDLANATPEQLDQMADGYEMVGEGLGSEIEKGMEEAGLPSGMLAATGSDPWATFDPRVMMGGNAQMFRELADAKRQRAIDDAAPDDSVKQAEALAENARVVGIETIDGREAFHIRAEDLNLTHEEDGQGMTVNAISMWIDREMHVPLNMKMDAIAMTEGESRPVTMERQNLDYRTVPGTDMYESYRQVARISGVMNAEQEAQMREAQQQMAEFEKQMEQMPAAQRDMIMRQMGPQLEMMESMSSGGGIEMVTEVHDIVVNHCERDEPLKRTVALGGVEVPPEMTTAMVSGTAGASEYHLDTDDDDVEVRPYYIDEEGIGVLRYSEPAGREFEYHMAISGLTTDPKRPREVLVGSMGPYAGPDVAIYMGSLNMMDVPLDLLEIEIYEDEPYRPVVRFRPVIDPDKAENMEDCGTVSSTGACSNAVTE